MLQAIEGGAGAQAGATTATTVDASSLISQARDPATGAVDTRALAAAVQQAAAHDPQTAARAYAEVEHELGARSPADASRFNADIKDAFRDAARPVGDAAAGAGTAAGRAGADLSARGAAEAERGAGLTSRGAKLLEDNPLLSKQWVSTRSQWTGKGGFTDSLQRMLSSEGISFNARPLPAPPGSLGRASGVPVARANNVNGALARDAVAARLTAQGATVRTEVDVPGTGRRVDVRGDYPAGDGRPAERVDVESKVGRKGADAETRAQVAKDGQALRDNAAVRSSGAALVRDGEAAAAGARTLSTAGKALEVGGRVLKPVAVAADALQLRDAYRADGGRIGTHTERTAAGVAGSWAGAAAGAELGAEAGAAIGSVVPGAGTVVGGVVGGLIGGAAGAFAGDGAGRKLFDGIKSLF